MIGPDEDKKPITSENVLYLGTLRDKELADAYDACDIFAMMSESESFGMVFCEAWSRKKPVIGNSNCGAVASLIDHGVDGLLCSDTTEVCRAIRQLLEDKKISDQFGARGYEKVIERYTWDKISEQVYQCYNNLVIRS
jgi:glycosyltransferase involved in cell wall biosynthesis